MYVCVCNMIIWHCNHSHTNMTIAYCLAHILPQYICSHCAACAGQRLSEMAQHYDTCDCEDLVWVGLRCDWRFHHRVIKSYGHFCWPKRTLELDGGTSVVCATQIELVCRSTQLIRGQEYPREKKTDNERHVSFLTRCCHAKWRMTFQDIRSTSNVYHAKERQQSSPSTEFGQFISSNMLGYQRWRHFMAPYGNTRLQ